uniref:(northern house mosquito) hypothetical protein n=1 Tax=Culex pipiens TaxID=7175 RepID=A0A8D8DES5_CULPI
MSGSSSDVWQSVRATTVASLAITPPAIQPSLVFLSTGRSGPSSYRPSSSRFQKYSAPISISTRPRLLNAGSASTSSLEMGHSEASKDFTGSSPVIRGVTRKSSSAAKFPWRDLMVARSRRLIRVLLPFRPLTVKSAGFRFRERRFAKRSVTKFICEAESSSTRHGMGVLHWPSTTTTAVERTVCFSELAALAHRVVDVPAAGVLTVWDTSDAGVDGAALFATWLGLSSWSELWCFLPQWRQEPDEHARVRWPFIKQLKQAPHFFRISYLSLTLLFLKASHFHSS